MLYTTEYASPIGPLTLASDGEGITGLWMHGQKYYAATLRGRVEEKNDLAHLYQGKRMADAYFDGKIPLLPICRSRPAAAPSEKRFGTCSAKYLTANAPHMAISPESWPQP